MMQLSSVSPSSPIISYLSILTDLEIGTDVTTFPIISQCQIIRNETCLGHEYELENGFDLQYYILALLESHTERAN